MTAYDFLITASAGSLSSVLGNVGSSTALCPHDDVPSAAAPCSGHYRRDILDGRTLDVIGGLFQDAVYDNSGEGNRVGTAQGYAYYHHDASDGARETWKWNANKIMFLDGGDVILLDNHIVAATGRYGKYAGGSIVENNNELDYTTAEITLMERGAATAATATAESVTQSTFRIDGVDGYYYPITNTNGTHIGEKFQNTMLHIDDTSDTIGMTRGYGYTFPSETFLSESLGVESAGAINSNRIFQFNDGEYVYAINNGIVFGSGPYAKYERGIYIEDVYDLSITFIPDSSSTATTDDEDEEGDDPTLYITTVGRFYEPIFDPRTNEVIGNRFQNPIYDSSSEDANRIGTEQGYVFNFPPATNTRDLSQGNRQLYLIDGTITVYNDIVVAATGRYTRYIQKILLETKETVSTTGSNNENGGEEEVTTSYVVQFEEPPAAVLTAEDVYADTNWGLTTPQAPTNGNVEVQPPVQDEKTTIALSLVLSIVAVLVVVVGIALSVVVYLRNQKEESDDDDVAAAAATTLAKTNEQQQQPRMNNRNDTNGNTTLCHHIQPTSPSLHTSRRRSTIDNTFMPTTLPHKISTTGTAAAAAAAMFNNNHYHDDNDDDDVDDINNKARISLITTNAVIVNPQSSRRRRATIDTSNSQLNRDRRRATIDTIMTNNGSGSISDSRRRTTLEHHSSSDSIRRHKLAMIEQMNDNLSSR